MGNMEENLFKPSCKTNSAGIFLPAEEYAVAKWA